MNTDCWSRAPGHPPLKVTNNTVGYMQPVGDIWGSVILGGIIHVRTELGGKIYFKKPHKISKKKGEEGYAIENTDNKILAP